MSQKTVAKNHITEQRFKCYSKARSFINHLNNVYDSKHDPLIYDQSLINHKLFKDQTPKNSNHKLSEMPTAVVAANLQDKIKLVNIFHTLSQRKMKKKTSKPKSTTPITRKQGKGYFKPNKYNKIIISLSNISDITTTRGSNTAFLTSALNHPKEYSGYLKNNTTQTKSYKKNFPTIKDSFKNRGEFSINFSCSEQNIDFSSNSFINSSGSITPFADIYNNRLPYIKKIRGNTESPLCKKEKKELSQNIKLSSFKQDAEVNTN
ncbi:hypothetical protein SteCoe_9727 [Stentor coeruleus]|uniref:Uncharacterized protein n=1 Tax=Stentor coeruleus TaxID=5963 RepID=A0A1R2CH39_9CILI|nr:hypothetical protein SteCoe_9727 [Stentor coeruleus]